MILPAECQQAVPHAIQTQPQVDRGLTRRWLMRSADIGGISSELSRYPAIVQRVFTARGLHSADVLEPLLNPSLTQLHDPSRIPDLDRAAERLLRALDANERITIYGDYDVDGITAAATLFHTLRALKPDIDPSLVQTYLPHRVDEGYGINAEALTQIREQGTDVVVSVDCGITAVAEAEHARSLGLDLIITDHHNPPATLDEMPRAFAVVHPRRPDSDYPFGELCGAGVAFKLAWRLCTMRCGTDKVTDELRTLLVELLALTALGTIADIVPLVDENRAIAHFGLRRVKHSTFAGLRALVEASGLSRETVDEEHAGFAIGPRLNAAGRMGHAAEALELLTTATGDRATQIAKELTRVNDQRRREQQRIEQHARELVIEHNLADDQSRAIVLAHPDWHPGIIGIVCSRLVETFGRPTILMHQREDGMCAGSGRSIAGYNLHAGLCACANILDTFGGHDMAAGMKVNTDKFEAFRDVFLQHASDNIALDQLTPAIEIDCSATLAELTSHTVNQLLQLRPFGAHNPRVRILLEQVRVAGEPSRFGADGKHLRVNLRPADDSRHAMTIVGWNWGDHWQHFAPGHLIDAVIEPKISTWGGRSRIEPELCDVRVIG